MKPEGTTSSGDDNGKRRDRHQRRRNLWRQHWTQRQWRPRHDHGPLHQPMWQGRPMWQEPLRGALYAAGSGLIALAFVWLQSRM
jgi:hypothetical protein